MSPPSPPPCQLLCQPNDGWHSTDPTNPCGRNVSSGFTSPFSFPPPLPPTTSQFIQANFMQMSWK